MLGVLPPTRSCLAVVALVGRPLSWTPRPRFANDALAFTVLMEMNKDYHCLFANKVHKRLITHK